MDLALAVDVLLIASVPAAIVFVVFLRLNRLSLEATKAVFEYSKEIARRCGFQTPGDPKADFETAPDPFADRGPNG